MYIFGFCLFQILFFVNRLLRKIKLTVALFSGYLEFIKDLNLGSIFPILSKAIINLSIISGTNPEVVNFINQLHSIFSASDTSKLLAALDALHANSNASTRSVLGFFKSANSILNIVKQLNAIDSVNIDLSILLNTIKPSTRVQISDIAKILEVLEVANALNAIPNVDAPNILGIFSSFSDISILLSSFNSANVGNLNFEELANVVNDLLFLGEFNKIRFLTFQY